MTNDSIQDSQTGEDNKSFWDRHPAFGPAVFLLALGIFCAAEVKFNIWHHDFLDSPVSAYDLEDLKVPCLLAGVNFTKAQLLTMTVREEIDIERRCKHMADGQTEAFIKQRLIEDLSKTK